MVEFGNRLKALRLRKGLTQDQLGVQIGVTKSAISTYENGSRKPTYETLIVLAKTLNVTTDYLLGVKSKSNSLDLSGLSDNQIATLKSLADSMRE